ncbi:MAG: hydantoinase B/oxoprolinase family protein [Phycisphaerales bacterium]
MLGAAQAESGTWHFAVDRGGTFTDVIASAPDGTLRTAKVLSESGEEGGDAISEAIARVLRENHASDAQVGSIRIGTTVATNALLTRTGVPTVLVVTQGLGDLVWIRDQSRPDLFALRIVRPEPIPARVIEARGRLDSGGREVAPLDEQTLHHDLAAAWQAGCRAAAICLMHGWQFDAHERQAARIARRVGFEHVLTSRDVPMRGYVTRLATLAADASLTPLLHRSLHTVRARFAGARLLGMQSNGGLVGLDVFRGVNAVLSGPAGGVVGAAAVGASAGFGRVVTLDMGGTSTDVAWYDGTLHRSEETRIAAERLRVPMLEVHTIAAGGGSICSFDGQRLRVGPDSAAAIPGPACYGRSGPPTITDCNVVLGRVPVAFLPSVFGPDGRQPASAEASRASLTQIMSKMRQAGHPVGCLEELADGLLAVAIEAMAGAVRRISIEQGRDLNGAALVAFGGAGGQVACRIAETLAIDAVLIHPLGGMLSAWGIASADQRVVKRASLEVPLDADGLATAMELVDRLCADAHQELDAGPDAAVRKRAVVRLADWEHGLEVDFGTVAQMRACFAQACLRRFGYEPSDETPFIAAVEAEAIARTRRPTAPTAPRGTPGRPRGRLPMWCNAAMEPVPWFDRRDLRLGQTIEGPALIREDGATTVIDAGWRASVLEDGTLRLERTQAERQRVAGECVPLRGRETDSSPRPDPVRLAVFAHRFRAIAEEMGAALQRTARSVNMRVRLDYSCAVFDARGMLVANGEHMPVHLGSMSESVRHIMNIRSDDMLPGDAFLLNDPFHGGTHLPDLTLVSPFFDDAGNLRAFVASRGHHVDIGGITPGSMPPDARRLEDEGIVIDNFLYCRGGRVRARELRELLTSGPTPCRHPERVIDDLAAQLAANRRGLEALADLAGEFTHETVGAFMQHLQDHAAQCVAARVRTLREGRAEVKLDGGGSIVVQVRVDHALGGAEFSFAGTAPQRDDNTNAPPAVTRAAVLYVLRCLIADDIPLNDGCLQNVRILLPEGSMLQPRPGAAVAAGNVETSQLVVDALLQATGALAASQGTMNNLTFGDGKVQYYETVCGGTGAGPGFHGAHAVQSHMTNSRLTDPEILEDHFPVRLVRFSRRFGSGGRGLYAGGDGVIRELEFLAPVTLSLLAGRREHAPPGAQGGKPGAPGRQRLVSRIGVCTELAGRFTRDVVAGDRLILETPGGGGWGPPVSAIRGA